jgi:RNA polymerase sigma-70 factor, ECF subfamily
MTMARTDFGKLYESHAAAVRRFVLFLGSDAALADDIVAETFARAWTVSAPLRQDTVKAYLFTIARNLYRQSARRARRHGELPVDLPDEAISAERLVNDRSELAAALSAMQLLPETDRAALLMRAVDQMSYEEIAQSLGQSTVNAKVRVHRARLKLMRFLTQPAKEEKS